MDQQGWNALCSRLGCLQLLQRFAVLRASYSEHHRHYHTATHIRECLDLFRRVVNVADHPDEVEFAIWLHDAVYRPTRSNNEERSADLAAGWLRDCLADEAVIERVRRLIVSTRHTDPPATRDEALLQDIDLGVLGASPERYAEYERQVRREYRWVPSFLFRTRRAELLESFLDRDAVYWTAWFKEHLESAARRNLSESVARLRGRGAV